MKHSLLLNRAFTLIELMIVMAIMAIAMAIIGPNTYKVYQKAKFQSNYVELRELLKSISYKAFINDKAVVIELAQDRIKYGYKSNVQSQKMIEHTFKYLSFPTQSIEINRSGFATAANISVNGARWSKTIDLTVIANL